MLGVGILGCGLHGERYLRHLLNDIPDAEPVCFYRRDAEASARLVSDHGVPRAESSEALITSDAVDAVIVATPPGHHLEALLRLLDSGKPVLLEKPALACWSEASRLPAADAPRVMVGQSLRYSPALRDARRRISELGEIHRIRLAQRLQPSALSWQRDATLAGGGSVILTGVHLFDLLRWFVGRTPDAVQCRLQRLLDHPLENSFDACFEFESEQILAATEVSKFGESRVGLLEVVGTEGQLVVDYLRGKSWRVSGNEWELLADFGPVPTLVGVLEDFVRMARGEIESPIPLRDGMENVRMAEACYRSHQQARRFRLTELESS